MKRVFRNGLFYVVLAIGALFIAARLFSGGTPPEKVALSDLTAKAAVGQLRSADIVEPDDKVQGILADGKKFETRFPAEYADELTTILKDSKNPDGKPLLVDAKHKSDSLLLSLLLNFLPFIFLFGIFFLLFNQMQGGGNRVMQFGKAKPKTISKDQPKVTFGDVAGADEAVAELNEIKEFLENPARFQAMGAKIPKGVLLFGPPGTGKTLLARAVAGEAGVPFFSISGSDFVEMFVGVGASRVRDLFEQAKAAAPAIIFVDEIDAVGRHRGAGLGGGHDEREQTLNQLLVEMDGFDAKTGVILIAATNRPDILDPALLRPGRFDRQIVVDRPDVRGRRAILDVHAKGKPLAEGVDLDVLARRTPGFTGADLANLLNEAALLSARHNFDRIGMMQLDEAIDRVLMGPERKSRVMSEKEKTLTAYHEAGHALVGFLQPEGDPIHKVSVVARGMALGVTWSLPAEDRYANTAGELKARLAMSLGGHAAEDIVFNQITTGAANDIEKVTALARSMVTEYGMSPLGPRKFGHDQGEIFLGRDMGSGRDYSDEIAARIDEEVDHLIEEAFAEARAIIEAHRPALDALAKLLLAKETVESAELKELWKDLPPWTPGKVYDRAPRASQRPIRNLAPVRSISARDAEAPAEAAPPAPPKPPAPPAPPADRPGGRKFLDRLKGTPGPSPA